MQLAERWNRSKAQWNILTHYQRFESAVAFVLTVVIALIVLVALYRLCIGVVTALLFGAVDPLEHTVFQSVFGQIMTLLIALEFNHKVCRDQASEHHPDEDRAPDCASSCGTQVYHSGYT
jgi:hypothetical protein